MIDFWLYFKFRLWSERYCWLLIFCVMLSNVWCEISKVQIAHYESQILFLILSYSIANLRLRRFFFNSSRFSNCSRLNNSRYRILDHSFNLHFVWVLFIILLHYSTIFVHFIRLIDIIMEVKVGEVAMEVHTFSLGKWSSGILLIPTR